jgi:hypothetical protein
LSKILVLVQGGKSRKDKPASSMPPVLVLYQGAHGGAAPPNLKDFTLFPQNLKGRHSSLIRIIGRADIQSAKW